MWFSSEAMTKGYQAYRDSWATVLSEEMLCLREVVIEVKTWQRSVTLKRRGQLPRPAYAKIKSAKISSKVNTAFSRNFAPAKFPAIPYGCNLSWIHPKYSLQFSKAKSVVV